MSNGAASDGERDRAGGCLMGLLVGDALGSQVEFQSAEQIARAYPDGVRELVDGGTWNTLAGQPTDDGELALTLARALIEAGGWEDEAVARGYVGWLTSRPFDVGNTIAQALGAGARALELGAELATACRQAANRESQANGALMRAAPLAALGAKRSAAEVVDLARFDASLTHPHPICLDANAVYVGAMAAAIRGEDALAAAQAAARAVDAEAVVREAIVAGTPSDSPHTGWVILALQGAFYELAHAASFEEALVQTISRGGDTDTTAAITGALYGAVHGLEAIPSRWRDAVLACRPERRPGVQHPRPEAFWPVDALELADRLLTL